MKDRRQFLHAGLATLALVLLDRSEASADMNRRVFVAEGGQPRYRLWDPPEAITRQKGP